MFDGGRAPVVSTGRFGAIGLVQHPEATPPSNPTTPGRHPVVIGFAR
jgi:hypothetical protein